jgi:hypothetical protein
MNSDNVKKIDFLKHDVNQNEYQMVKSGKTVLNLPKHQLYNHHHSTIHEFVINSKTSIPKAPFGNSNWYVDYDLPSLNYCYHQFILRLSLYNTSATNTIYTLPLPMCVDRVVLLKNSNVLSEVNSEDIFLYNLHKMATKFGSENDDYINSWTTGMITDTSDKNFLNPYVNSRQYQLVHFELPLNLTNSNILSSLIKNQLTLRIYFKGNIVTSTSGSNSDLELSELKLFLRMKESAHNLHKEPKLNHSFMKKILTQINIPKLDAATNYSLNLSGFHSVASFALVFIREQDNNIKYDSVGKYHEFKYQLRNVSICDGTGKNIFESDLIIDYTYNNFLLIEHFKQFAPILNRLCKGGAGLGPLYLLPFCNDAGKSFEGNFNGGYNFKSSQDYSIKFTSAMASTGSVVLNILWFSPSLLCLDNGDLCEYMS